MKKASELKLSNEANPIIIQHAKNLNLSRGVARRASSPPLPPPQNGVPPVRKYLFTKFLNCDEK